MKDKKQINRNELDVKKQVVNNNKEANKSFARLEELKNWINKDE